MRLQLKKTQAAFAPNWHPNYRHVESLPDLKPIRTSFFVNVLCITMATGALIFTSHREFLMRNVRVEINLAQERIEFAREQNHQLLEQSRVFSETRDKFATAAKFSAVPVAASTLLTALARSLPDNMDFASVSYENEVLVLRGTIRGASENASTRLSAYLDVLREDEVVGSHFLDVELKNLLRDPRTQGLSFEIVLKQPAREAKEGAA